MAVLLGKWLNKKFSLPRPVDSLEADLATGYLLGHVLSQCNAENRIDQYIDEDTTYAKINNFELLAESLRESLNIKLDIPKAREIMLGKPGTVASLVFIIKKSLEEGPSSSSPKSKNPHSSTVTGSLRPPPPVLQNNSSKRRYIDRTTPENTSDRFIKTTVESLNPSDPHMMDKMSEEIHLRNFREEEWRYQAVVIAKEQRQEDETRALVRSRKERMTTQFRTQRLRTKLEHEAGLLNWTSNRKKDDAREATALSFELSLLERRKVKDLNRKTLETIDMKSGIAAFDRNYQRLGIGDSKPSTTESYCSSSQAEELFSIEKNAEMMKLLKEKRASAVQASKERETRRRKMLVDQAETAVSANAKARIKELKKSLLGKGKAERRDGFLIWERKKLKERAIIEKELNVRQTAATLYNRMEESLVANLQSIATLSPRSITSEKHNQNEKKKKHLMLGRDTVDAILNFVNDVLDLREQNLKSAIHPKDYRALKRRFIKQSLHRNETPVISRSQQFYVTGFALNYCYFENTEEENYSDQLYQTCATVAVGKPSTAIDTYWKEQASITSTESPVLICIVEKDDSSYYAKLVASSFDFAFVTLEDAKTFVEETDDHSDFPELESQLKKKTSDEELLNALMIHRFTSQKDSELKSSNCRSRIILSGYPSTSSQYVALEKVFDSIDWVFVIEPRDYTQDNGWEESVKSLRETEQQDSRNNIRLFVDDDDDSKLSEDLHLLVLKTLKDDSTLYESNDTSLLVNEAIQDVRVARLSSLSRSDRLLLTHNNSWFTEFCQNYDKSALKFATDMSVELSTISDVLSQLHQSFDMLSQEFKEKLCNSLSAEEGQVIKSYNEAFYKKTGMSDCEVEDMISELELELGNIAEENRQRAESFLSSSKTNITSRNADKEMLQVFVGKAEAIIETRWRTDRVLVLSYFKEIEPCTASTIKNNLEATDDHVLVQKAVDRIKNFADTVEENYEEGLYNAGIFRSQVVNDIDSTMVRRIKSLCKVAQKFEKELNTVQSTTIQNLDEMIGTYMKEDESRIASVIDKIRVAWKTFDVTLAASITWDTTTGDNNSKNQISLSMQQIYVLLEKIQNDDDDWLLSKQEVLDNINSSPQVLTGNNDDNEHRFVNYKAWLHHLALKTESIAAFSIDILIEIKVKMMHQYCVDNEKQIGSLIEPKDFMLSQESLSKVLPESMHFMIGFYSRLGDYYDGMVNGYEVLHMLLLCCCEESPDNNNGILGFAKAFAVLTTNGFQNGMTLNELKILFYMKNRVCSVDIAEDIWRRARIKDKSATISCECLSQYLPSDMLESVFTVYCEKKAS